MSAKRPLSLLVILVVIFSSIFLTQKAGAEFSVDQLPPDCFITFSPASPQPTNTKITISVTADDANTGGSGIALLSTLQSTSPQAPQLATDISPNPNFVGTGATAAYYWTPTTPGTFTFSVASATDTAGNVKSPCISSSPPYTIFIPPPPPPVISAATSCPSPGTQAYLYWSRSPTATYYEVRSSPNFNPVLGQIPDTGADPVTATANTVPNTAYTWWVKACNTTGCSSEAQGYFFCQAPPAWLRTSGGDVHSNQ